MPSKPWTYTPTSRSNNHGHKAHDDELVAATSEYFKMGPDRFPTVAGLAEHYRQRNTVAVVFTIDATAGLGHRPNSVEDLIGGAARNNDVLIPFGTVDPWKGNGAVRCVHELVGEYGVKGFKFHPSMQAFEPNDRVFYPIYEAIAEAGVPALFHTGQTGIGAGLPGGHRIKLRYSDPMLLDDVAADFPELTVVMAHPAVRTSTCPAGRRSTSRNSSARPVVSCTRCGSWASSDKRRRNCGL
jgi:predicted TIM-barrel fold metal-dependent hydrolase